MAKKPRQPAINRQLLRLFERSANNIDRFASRLKISPTSAEKILDNIYQGKRAIKEGVWTERIQARLNEARGYGVGDNPAHQIGGREGENYVIRDYELNLGETIPEEYEGQVQSFQIIIKGIEKGEERYVTTYANQSLEGALNEMETLMSQYREFTGTQVIVRAFIPTWGEND